MAPRHEPQRYIPVPPGTNEVTFRYEPYNPPKGGKTRRGRRHPKSAKKQHQQPQQQQQPTISRQDLIALLTRQTASCKAAFDAGNEVCSHHREWTKLFEAARGDGSAMDDQVTVIQAQLATGVGKPAGRATTKQRLVRDAVQTGRTECKAGLSAAL